MIGKFFTLYQPPLESVRSLKFNFKFKFKLILKNAGFSVFPNICTRLSGPTSEEKGTAALADS